MTIESDESDAKQMGEETNVENSEDVEATSQQATNDIEKSQGDISKANIEANKQQLNKDAGTTAAGISGGEAQGSEITGETKPATDVMDAANQNGVGLGDATPEIKAAASGISDNVKKALTTTGSKMAGAIQYLWGKTFADSVEKQASNSYFEARKGYTDTINNEWKSDNPDQDKINQAEEGLAKLKGGDFEQALDKTKAAQEVKAKSGDSGWEKFKSMLRMIGLLGTIGGIFAFMFIYSKEHTGCYIYQNGNSTSLSSSSPTCNDWYKKENNAVFCSCGSAGMSVDPSDNPISASTWCKANATDSTDCSSPPCLGVSECPDSAGDSSDACLVAGKPYACTSGDQTAKGSVYYSYQITTPLQALGDLPAIVGKGLGNFAGSFISSFLKILKPVGIVVGIILLLLILFFVGKAIYRGIKNKKSKSK